MRITEGEALQPNLATRIARTLDNEIIEFRSPEQMGDEITPFGQGFILNTREGRDP
jgi:hypothetical protein